jgi:murein DD-endopeptidase MepM/ murein hydrolase activator NlpD
VKRTAQTTPIASFRRACRRLVGVDLRLLTGLLLAGGVTLFVLGRWTAPPDEELMAALVQLQQQIHTQQGKVDQLRIKQGRENHALAARLGELQAASTRIDALGERLVQVGQLPADEFQFGQPPPLGGPQDLIEGHSNSGARLSTAIHHLSVKLRRQSTQLDALQALLLNRRIEKDHTPAGWPVRSGWISSRFGERNDPFTGKRSRHNGLDFAGTRGTEVLSVAAGVVIWSGSRMGYGRTVEVDHGNGYVTRYAHNDQYFAQVGDQVRAGQKLASMGDTGRASSPHVHFEVLKNGSPINPLQFTDQLR